MNAHSIPAWVAGIMGALIALVDRIPSASREALVSLFLLMAVDLVTGLGVAVLRREMRSHIMRTKSAGKLFQYAGVLAIFGVASALADSPLPFQGAVLVLCGVEVASIWENCCLLQVVGVNLGPLNGLLERTRPYFGIAGTPERPQAPANPWDMPEIALPSAAQVALSGGDRAADSEPVVAGSREK